ncbi:carbon-nitrogen hydrolase family protein [Candidatus Bathyarchaeota archaeon]|nr:carbon-nitrogen hydrolase family protein [Candidatus Bathyarchaeota archaeon]
MSKKTITAAAVQTRPSEASIGQTVLNAMELVKEAAKKEADIVCLPEHWLPEKKIPTPISPLPALQKLAREYGIVIVAGAFYEKVDGHTRLSSPVIRSDGSIAGRQFKVHLFRSERKLAKPGNNYRIFGLDGFKIGILVCYDVDFPEPARIYALKGADLILCPSRIVKPGVTPWQQYVTVRCLENRIPIVAPNVYAPPWFTGHSIIISLREDRRTRISHPKISTIPREEEGVVLQKIDLALHNRLRKARFADRRPDTYG